MPLKVSGRTLYKISEACALAGTNRDTYLRWIREGKFHDVVSRDRNGWRLFTKNDIARLKAKVSQASSVETILDGLVSGKSYLNSPTRDNKGGNHRGNKVSTMASVK